MVKVSLMAFALSASTTLAAAEPKAYLQAGFGRTRTAPRQRPA